MKKDTVSQAYVWYVVGALHVLYICSFIDRELIGVLVGPMKRDIHLSDTQVGLIQGLAFALCYSIVGIPIGRLADRVSRKYLIAVGVFLWSLMTTLSGFAHTAASLFVARTTVGIGEASLSPSAYSLITDLFDKARLSRAMSLYGLGSTIGGSLAIILGGTMVSYLETKPPVHIPHVATIFAWQEVFFIVGLPGFVLALLFMLTVKEPARRDMLRTEAGAARTSIPLKESWHFVLSRWRIYTLLFGGHAFYSLAAYGSSAWMPTFFARIHGWNMQQVAERYGVVGLLSNLVGPVAAGWFADRLYVRGNVDASVKLSGFAMFAAAGCSAVVPLTDSATTTIALLAITNILMSFLLGLPLASIQLITPNQLRGQVSAIFLFVVNLIGIGLGATSIGFLTDHVFGNEYAVRYSLAIVPASALLIGGVALLLCCRPFRACYELSKQWASQPAGA